MLAFTPFYMAFHFVGICVCLFVWLLEQPQGVFERRPTGQLPPLPITPSHAWFHMSWHLDTTFPHHHYTNFICWQAICAGRTDAESVRINIFNIGQGEDNA